MKQPISDSEWDRLVASHTATCALSAEIQIERWKHHRTLREIWRANPARQRALAEEIPDSVRRKMQLDIWPTEALRPSKDAATLVQYAERLAARLGAQPPTWTPERYAGASCTNRTVSPRPLTPGLLARALHELAHAASWLAGFQMHFRRNPGVAPSAVEELYAWQAACWWLFAGAFGADAGVLREARFSLANYRRYADADESREYARFFAGTISDPRPLFQDVVARGADADDVARARAALATFGSRPICARCRHEVAAALRIRHNRFRPLCEPCAGLEAVDARIAMLRARRNETKEESHEGSR